MEPRSRFASAPSAGITPTRFEGSAPVRGAISAGRSSQPPCFHNLRQPTVPPVRALLISIVSWSVVCAVGVLVLLWAGLSPLVVLLAGIAVAMFGPHVYMRYWVPHRLRTLMQRLADPAQGPPKEAEPVEDGFPQRLIDAVESGASGLEDWLADDFAMVDHRGRRYDARRYLASQRALLVAFPDLTERVEELRADFDVPDVLWMLSTQTGHSRHGAAYDATVWSKLTLTRDRSRIREIAFAGVVRAG
jgi:hypothetical protein